MIHRNPLPARFGPRRLALAAVAAGAFLVPAPVALAADTAVDELRQEIDALQAKLEKIETAQDAKPTAFDRITADAAARSTPSFLQMADDPDPFTAGHNGKFLLQSEDGTFSLNPNFQLQVRHVANFGPFDPAESDPGLFDDADFGWELRRTKIGFKGNAFSTDLTYDIKFAFSRNSGTPTLENGFVDYTPESGLFGNEALGFRIGQYKDPTFTEESTSSSRQLAVDRSLVNETLGGGVTDFVQGIGLLYKGDKVKGLFAYTDGLGSANTNFVDNATDLEVGLSGRVDIVVLGDDDSAFKDFTALGTDADAAKVGFGAFLELNDSGDFGYRLLHSADIAYETAGGLSVFAAYYGDLFDDGSDAVGADGFNVGGLAQVAQVLDADAGWEVFGRYNFVILDEVDASGEDFYHEVTAGVNKYWESHKVKATVDLSWLVNGQPAGFGSNSGLGYRGASPGANEEGQFSIRGQFQLLL
jgi:hypothetical protein